VFLLKKIKTGIAAGWKEKLEEVNLIGLKLKVLVAGTLFLGGVTEPVKSLKDPVRNPQPWRAFYRKTKGCSVQLQIPAREGKDQVGLQFQTR
jgi:hypothetical protein